MHSFCGELSNDGTYKEKHFGLEHNSDGSWRSDGWRAGWDSQTELHVPLQLGCLVRELQE